MHKIVSISQSAQRPAHHRRKRGMAVLLVLGLMAVTLAVSYATLRGQGITSELARNNSRALDAREAARSGLAAALRKMSEDGWAGVNAPFSANVTNNSWYEVSFQTGDEKFPNDPEWAFRVTIKSKGYASDPTNTAVRSSHESRSVVQLLRRAILAEPSNWSALTNKTVYQWSNNTTTVQTPVRINGSATILGPISLFPDYPSNSGPGAGANGQYLSDLFLRIAAGKGDARPLPSPLNIALSRQDGTTLTKLQTRLGMVLVDDLSSTTDPLTHPGAVTQYRLYPGGVPYDIPLLSGTLTGQTYGPSPATNPLGIFRTEGTLFISNNVTITGTLITSGSGPDVRINGTSGVVLQAANLPALNGTSQVYQLPVALCSSSLRFYSNCDATINGFTMVWDEFELQQGVASTKFAVTGNVATKRLTLKGRSSWVTPSSIAWSTWKSLYDLNLLNPLDPNYQLFFPDFMQNRAGLTVQPVLTFTPDSSGVLPHWQDWSQPVYQKASGDLGLKWEVVRWEEET